MLDLHCVSRVVSVHIDFENLSYVRNCSSSEIQTQNSALITSNFDYVSKQIRSLFQELKILRNVYIYNSVFQILTHSLGVTTEEQHKKKTTITQRSTISTIEQHNISTLEQQNKITITTLGIKTAKVNSFVCQY